MAASRNYCTTLKTYGPKPKTFRLTEDGEEYYLGSEVGNHLRMFRGDLYKKYPGLWKRKMSADERRLASEQIGYGHSNISSNVQIVRSTEVEEVLNGNDDKFRSALSFDTGGHSHGSDRSHPPSSFQTASSTTASSSTSTSGANTRGKKGSWMSQIPSSSFHLDAVPCASPVGRFKLSTKKVKSYPTCYNDKYPTLLYQTAIQPESLVPIRLDIDIDGQKLRETFTWNKNEMMLTPEQFAEVLCDDLDLPSGSFAGPIAQSIRQQCDQFSNEMIPEDEEDRRVVVKLNIHVGNISLVDQFEWDISNPRNSPEEFARLLCADLGLGGEFVATIAYSIRGQLSWHAKTYAFSEAPLPPVKFPVRQLGDVEAWGPSIQVLTDSEMEKKMRDQDRNTRRMRRLAQAAPGW